MIEDEMERKKAVLDWLVKLLNERLKDPTVIPPPVMADMVELMDAYMLEHAKGDRSRANGFADGTVVALVAMVNTGVFHGRTH